MSWASPPPSLDDVEANLAEARDLYLARRELRLHLYLRGDGSFVGASGLHHIDWTVPRFEIGYWVRSSQTGKGLATEAVSRISRFAFEALGAERLEIWCDARNLASMAVAKRAGFELEARLAHHRRNVDGALSDSLCFARLRS